MSQAYKVAVVGATGVVGQEIIRILEARQFPVSELIPLASERSVGKRISFNGQEVSVQLLCEEAFDGVDFALFSAGSSISQTFCPIAAKKGVICIDNTSFFRMHDEIPLVVPEVNAAALKTHKGIIANPNCSTAQLVVVLKPILERYGIKRIVISTYQSVSGAGKAAIDELHEQTGALLAGKTHESKIFPHQIAFNVLPHIDVFLENGYTKEEMKMVNEIQKIMGVDVPVTATTVRVPVVIGHSESVNVECERPVDVEECRRILAAAPGVQVLDNPETNGYPTPVQVAGEDDVFVGRIRKDISVENGIAFWCVGDNLRKGAALNAVQIAEALL